MITNSRQEYIKRINAVIEYVEKNLDRDLSIETLSEKAFFSPFHFHRIFSAIIGETINTFINRKRIERIASILLSQTFDGSLNELAYKYGFSCGSSLSRAFKKFYGVSPTEFKNCNGRDMLSKIGIDSINLQEYICSIDNIKKWISMNAQIEVKELSEIKLVGIKHIGEFDKIRGTYDRLFQWAYGKGLLNNPNLKVATIYHDNPKVTEMAKVRQSACITVDKEIDEEGEIGNIRIEGGKYVVGHFEVSGEDFQKAWEGTTIWVVDNNLKFRDRDYFELFHNDYRTHPEKKFIVDICIPVE